MNDKVYARELLAILTNPDPTGIDPEDPYGRADDGIDRYDGFGRDVWVEELTVVDGDHGAELQVGFALAVPADPVWHGMATRGSVRLPFDSDWRKLCGYETPAAYAPVIALQVEIAAHRQVERHRDGPSGAAARRAARAALPSRDVQWQMLLDALSSPWRRAIEVARGRIELRVEHPDQPASADVITVVATAEEWETVLAERAGDDADSYIAELLGPRDADEKFVVFFDGDLVRSTREELPPVRGRAFERKLAQRLAQHPGAQGHWSAHRPADDPDLR